MINDTATNILTHDRSASTGPSLSQGSKELSVEYLQRQSKSTPVCLSPQLSLSIPDAGTKCSLLFMVVFVLLFFLEWRNISLSSSLFQT